MSVESDIISQDPFKVKANGKVYRLTDFETEWKIPQANAMARYIKHLTSGVRFDDQFELITSIIGNLAENDLTQEVLAVMFVPENEPRWNSAKYKEWATDLADLSIGTAVEAFKRFFTGIKFLEAVVTPISSTENLPVED